LRGRGARGGDRGRAVRPLRRRWGRDRRAGPLAERAGRGDPHRQAALGPLHGLGHAAQPRLRRAGLLRQNDAHRSGRRAQPHRPPRARLQQHTVAATDREDRLEMPATALVAKYTWHRAQRRLADNKRYATRNSINPSLLQGICACSSCGYAYYRTSTRTTNKKIYYYRCLGSDDYRYEHGRVCTNKPVRADYLDTVVWNHITALLADPALIRNEINKRLEQARTVDPATAQRQRLDAGLAKATTAITRLIGAYQEELISL